MTYRYGNIFKIALQLVFPLILSACSTPKIHDDFLANFSEDSKSSASRVASMAYNDKEKYLVVGHSTGSIDIWDTREARSKRVVTAHASQVNLISFTSDGTGVFTNSNSHSEETTKLWNVKTGELLYSIQGTRGPVCATSSKGIYLIANDDRIRIFDYEKMSLLPESKRDKSGDVILTMATDATSDHVAIGTASGTIEIWEFSKDGERLRLKRKSAAKPYPVGDWVVGLQFSPGGESLYSVSRSGSIDEWSVSTSTLIKKRSITSSRLKLIHSTSFSQDKKFVALGGTVDSAGFGSGFVEMVSLPSEKSSSSRVNTTWPIVEFISQPNTLIAAQTKGVQLFPMPPKNLVARERHAMPAMHVIGVYEGKTPPGIDDRPWWAKCNDDRKDKQPFAASAPPAAPPSGECHQKYAGVQTEKEVVVNVSDDSGPIVLALTAYDRTLWKVSLASGVKLRKVILAGYHTQRVSGIPAETPIETYTYEPSPCERCWQGSEYFYSYQKPPEKLMEITGLDVTSFQGRYKGTEFFIFPADVSLKRDKDAVLAAALKRDKDAVLAAVKQTGRALKNAQPAMQNDEEVVEAAVMADPSHGFEYASPRLKRDAEFILKMLTKNKSHCCDLTLRYADASLKNDTAFMSKALAINTEFLRFGGEAIKKDKEIGLYAINHDRGYGRAFAQLDISLKDDIDVAWAAIKRYGGAYKGVSDRLKKDRELALAAVKWGAFMWKDVAPSLKDDIGFVHAAAALNPEVMEYMDEGLRQDKAIVLIASSHSKKAEKLIKGSFRRDKDVVLAAIEKSDGALPLLLDESFQSDEDFIRSAVRRNGGALRYAPAEFIKDKEIVLAAVRNSGIALAFAEKAHQQDRDIVLAAVTQDWRALAYADKALRNDPDIVRAAASQNAKALIYTDQSLANQIGRELGLQIGSEQFIGEISPAREHIRVDSSVLTADGKRIYVLKDGTLSQYQIDPFKLIRSFKVGIDSVQPEKRSDWYQIFITPDESKIVIHDKSSIKLLDLTTRNITKSISHDSQNGLLVDNVFVTFGSDNVLTLWNAENLRKIKTIAPDYKWTGTREVSHDEGTRFQNEYSLSRGGSNVFRLGDRVVIYIPAYISSHAGAPGDIFLVDKDSFKLDAHIEHHSEDPTLSFDHKSIYVNGLKLREPSKKNAKVENGGFWDIQKYDLESGDVTVVKPEKTPKSNAARLSFRGLSPNIPPAGQFHLLHGQVFASPDGKDATKSLYVYEDGEAVLFRYKQNTFELTENARRYLRMKGSNDPVDDATFDKFVILSGSDRSR